MNKKIFLILKLLPKIGYGNFLYMIYYTLSLKFKLRKSLFKNSSYKLEQNFYNIKKINYNPKLDKCLNVNKILLQANNILINKFTFYSNDIFLMDSNCLWFFDPYSKKMLHSYVQSKHWCDINEFDLNTGDIKNLWEISRFDWAITLAKAFCVSNDQKYINKLEKLLNDWCIANPYNIGVNWKCGQEVSIRIMKLFYVSLILGELHNISEVLFDFIYKHLIRINANVKYAIVQNNNHGTSETAALYIGSLWLLNQKNNNLLTSEKKKKLKRLESKGRDLLINRINRLVLIDGSFAQKSTNYHRVVIDTMSFVFTGMNEFPVKAFNKDILDKLDALGKWLLDMICNGNGAVFNLGANDGALFEKLHELDYRDYRPSIQLYIGLLKKQLVWDEIEVLAPLIWRNIDYKNFIKNENLNDINSIKDGEFVIMEFEDIKLLVNAKQDNFRPSNDILHLDLFYQGCNIILDTGSFSYNSEESSKFKSIAAHNTLQFGNDEPMPRISRFLNGKWIKVIGDTSIFCNNYQLSWQGNYTDYKGNYHNRKVIIDKELKELIIIDDFKSNILNQKVTLSFHLITDFEKYVTITCKNEKDEELQEFFSVAEHSLYYMNKENISKKYFISREQEGSFITTIKFKK